MSIKKILPNQELFVVGFDALLYLDNFLISSVSAIIFIRTYLFFTGYPQIGGDSLHIAHMLWGGMLMMITLVCLLAFINKQVKIWGSIVGGIGFGIFIDELGKFITKDNNYFFQPTIALVYLVFLLTYFAFRKIFHMIEKDDKEFILNALELLKEAVFFDLDTNEKRKLVQYLKQAGDDHPLVAEMEHLVEKLETIPVGRPTGILGIRSSIYNFYQNILKHKDFVKVLFMLIFINVCTQVYLAVLSLDDLLPAISFWEIGLLISVSLAVAFSLWGVLKFISKNNTLGYIYVQRASMVSILFVQFFAFYFHQLTAMLPLLASFVIYIGVQAQLNEVRTSASRTGPSN